MEYDCGMDISNVFFCLEIVCTICIYCISQTRNMNKNNKKKILLKENIMKNSCKFNDYFLLLFFSKGLLFSISKFKVIFRYIFYCDNFLLYFLLIIFILIYFDYMIM